MFVGDPRVGGEEMQGAVLLESDGINVYLVLFFDKKSFCIRQHLIQLYTLMAFPRFESLPA